MKFKFISLFFFSIMGFLPLYSQNYLVNDRYMKPNSESNNISLGTETINIGLAEINFGGVQLPISIMYTGNPPKYTDLPGLVGHSWNFNFQYHLNERNNMFETEDPLYPLSSPSEMYYSSNKKIYKFVDFNTPNGNGSFLYLNNEVKWLTNFSEKFRYDEANYPTKTLMDERGWKYFFGETLVLNESLKPEELAKNYSINASLLKQIIAPNNDTLTVTYGQKKIVSQNKRLALYIQEPKDIAIQLDQYDAITKVDTVSVSEKTIYYPLRITVSTGEFVEFNYEIKDNMVLLTQIVNSHNKVRTLNYRTDKYSTLLTQISADQYEYYQISYYDVPNTKDLLVDCFGDYCEKNLDPVSPLPSNLLNSFPHWPSFEYFSHIIGDANGGVIPTVSSPIALTNANMFYALKNAYQDPYYMLKSIQYPKGVSVSYEYEVLPPTYLGFVPGPGYRISQKIIQDVTGDTVSMNRYSYEGAQNFPFWSEDDISTYNPWINNYVKEETAVYTSYRMNNWSLDAHHYSLSRNFQVSNVPIFASEEEEYAGKQAVYHKKVTIESMDSKGKIGKSVYSFDIPSTINRTRDHAINYTMNVLGQGIYDRISYPSWPSELDFGKSPSLLSEIHFTFHQNDYKPQTKKEYTYGQTTVLNFKKVNWSINNWNISGDLPEYRIYSDCNLKPYAINGLEAGFTMFNFFGKALNSVKKTNYFYNN